MLDEPAPFVDSRIATQLANELGTPGTFPYPPPVEEAALYVVVYVGAVPGETAAAGAGVSILLSTAMLSRRSAPVTARPVDRPSRTMFRPGARLPNLVAAW